MKLCSALGIVAVFALAASSASALDATWVHTNTAAAGYWYDLENWVDANGNTPDRPPTNIADTVTLAPLLQTYAVQEPIIGTPQSTTGNQGLNLDAEIASLTGERSYRLQHTQLQAGSKTVKRQMYVGNPNGFLGYWSVGDAWASFRFGATPSFTPILHNVYPVRRVELEVTDAGTTVSVERVSNAGFIDKTGTGALSIGDTVGVDAGVYLQAGTLELRGGDADGDQEIAAILSGALLHLDASVDSTLEMNSVDEGGRVCVTRWNDVRGGDWPYAVTNSYGSSYQYFMPFTRAPYVAAETSPTGLRLVSFGSNVEVDGDALGPTNCVLEITPRLTNVRELFAVILAPRGMVKCTVISDVREPDLLHYSSGYFGRPDIVDELMINGVHVVNAALNPLTMTNAFVSSLLTTHDTPVSLLGSDRYYFSRSGGSRIGEVILLGEPVTDVQRQRIARMLTKKWLGSSDATLGCVIADSGTAISVPDGRVAKVETLGVKDGTIVKEGGGVLEIGLLQNGKVRVEDGSVAFTTPTPVTYSAPAGEPSLWLDATKTATLLSPHSYADSDFSYYGEWKDCRDGNSQVATWPSDQGLEREPFLVEDAAGAGLDALSFGNDGDTTRTWMKLPGFNQNNVDVYAGFIVCRPNREAFAQNVFGSSAIEMRRECTGKLLSTSYRQARASTAIWAVNGELADPFLARPELQQTNDFVVISFLARETVIVDSLCKDRIHATAYRNNCGGLQIGELLLYKRALTEAERVATEAYLMNKWLGKTHPCDTSGGRTVPAVEFASDVPVVVDSESSLEMDKVVGGDGSLVKKGSGTASLGKWDTAISSIDVRAGELRLTPSANIITTPPPRFRFDAKAEDTVKYSVVDNGDGTSRTNVTKWLDADGNGFYALPPATFSTPGVKNGDIVATNPTLVQVSTDAGLVPAVDFGVHSGHKTEDQRSTTAGMNIFYSEGKAVPGKQNCILEAFVVWQDREDCTTMGYTHLFNDSSTYHYHRNGTKILADNAAPGGTQAGTKDGYHAVDGVEVPYDHQIDKNVHVVNFAPTNVTAVNRLVWDRTSNAGGARVFEMICYTNELPVAQRKFMEKSLMTKWLGTPTPVWTNTYTSVAVAPGATLTMTAADAISTPSLTLGGTITASAVVGVESLVIPCVDGIPQGTVQSLPIEFAEEEIPVTLDGFDVKAFRRAGLTTVTLLEAESITGATGFTLVNDLDRYGATLLCTGTELKLSLQSPGMLFIVR